MIQQLTHSYKGMNQDLLKDKQSLDLYYDANNIRIIDNTPQSLGGVSNEKGNKLLFTIPSPVVNSNGTITYGDKSLTFKLKTGNELLNSNLPSISGIQRGIGNTLTKDGFILFSTDNNGFDCIWEVIEILEGNYDLKLLYCRNLGFSSNNPIQAVFNYENENIQKIYWVDGINQLRFLNIKHSILNGDPEELIDLKSSSINMVGDYSLSQIKLSNKFGGGTHTSGMIQYAYNLYNLNGSQTTISPLSELIPLDKGANNGGGEVNEIVGTSLSMNIETLDDNYSYIKIYAIKYTSFNEIPSISLIKNEKIDTYSNYSFIDSGSVLGTLSLSEFLFLGSNPFNPKHIESKDNRLFASSYDDSAFKLDIDCRAYSHDSQGNTKLYTGDVTHNGTILEGGNIQLFFNYQSVDTYDYPLYDDAINPDYDKYKYQKNGAILGGEGKFIKYRLVKTNKIELTKDLKYLRFFKDDEIYRIGIQFYNKYGQKTEVKWIADFKAPKGNLGNNFNTLEVSIKETEFNNYINSLNLSDVNKPVGYKIVRANRELKDRTILCQGVLTGMMVQTFRNLSDRSYWRNESNRQKESLSRTKIPLFLTRGFTIPSEENVLYPSKHLRQMSEFRGEDKDEIYSDNRPSYRKQNSWQYNKMMQMYSPDILFNTGLTFGEGLKLKPKGLALHTETNWWSKRINTGNGETTIERKFTDVNSTRPYINEGRFGIIGPEWRLNDDRTGATSYNRKYNDYLDFNNDNKDYHIYGAPEITEKDQGTKTYNGDPKFNYINNLKAVISDGRHNDAYDGLDNDLESITSVNSVGARCLTIVLGKGRELDEKNRKSIEDLLPNFSYLRDGLVLSEVKRDKSYTYNGQLYGGLSVANKSNTEYIEIGEYKSIDNVVNFIESPGDIYVQNFKIGRISKDDTQILDVRVITVTEAIEFNVETTINLDNRNDTSFLGWDNVFQPKYDDYHKYNRVYSQSNTLVKSTTDNSLIRDVNNFDTRIISSKLKIPNETIDSWTDFLENETIDLDGKYGPITSLLNWNDNMYALQTFATSLISINPRVQTQANDGVGIELGTGNILHDYNYLSTSSGCSNKWSPILSPSGFYFIDIVNNDLIKVQGNQLSKLSLTKGMNSFFQNNLNYSILKKDNPFLKEGITGIYDRHHETALFTVLQGNNSFTLSYNEKSQMFESFYDYKPSMYINKGFKLLSLDEPNNGVYEHFTGKVGEYYGVLYPSNITMQYFTQYQDSIFNNITFRSMLSENGVDIRNKSLTQIKAWNEYQNTGLTDLILNKNISRKFRLWKANIPRVKVNGKPTLDRMRGQWFKLLLQFDNVENQNLILHDTNIYYTAYPN